MPAHIPAPRDRAGYQAPDEAWWEQQALDWLAEPCGWRPVAGVDIAPRKSKPDGTADPDSPRRTAWNDLVLPARLHQAIQNINPHLPPDAVAEAAAAFSVRESGDPFHEFHRVHTLLTSGVKVPVTDPATGETTTHTAWALDFTDPYANDFLAANQVTLKSPDDTKTRRLDVVGYVNGLPLAVIELKSAFSSAGARDAHKQLATYRGEYGSTALAPVAFAVASDGITARVGTLHTSWEHMAPWDVDDKNVPIPLTTIHPTHDDADGRPTALEILLAGVFEPARFLDLLSNFLAFSKDKGGAVDTVRLAKAHQYIAVNKAVDRTVTAVAGDGQIGVVWHTQGSGKSEEMNFYTAKVMKHPALRNPTVLVLTDRIDLDDQLYGTFARSELLPEQPVQADTTAQLRTHLAVPSGGIVFSTLQKFRVSKEEQDAGLNHQVLSARQNIIIIVDEAHRSHYNLLQVGGFAKNLRDALPHASLIAFTGTPISNATGNTLAVFGDYIDIYDLNRAVRDGATVKVYYEARHIPVSLPEGIDIDLLDGRAEDLTADLDEEERKQARRAMAAYEDVVGAPDRIKKLAADIVEHWETRREVMGQAMNRLLPADNGEEPRLTLGKGMIVGVSRRVCAELYKEITALRPDWHSDDDKDGIIKCVYTGSATDEQPIQAHVRSQGAIKEIQKRVVDENDKLELVIVQSLWLTGFDSPPLHTLYLDKPMRGAALMQAIARVNRRFGEKPAGLVVDFLGIADNLTKALAEYTHAGQPTPPVIERAADAVKVVQDQHSKLSHILAGGIIIEGRVIGIDWKKQLRSASAKSFVHTVLNTVDYLKTPEPELEAGKPTVSERYLKHARDLARAHTLCPTAPDLRPIQTDLVFFEAVRQCWLKFKAQERDAQGLDSTADIQLAIRQLTALAVAADDVVDIYQAAGLERPDLSHLDEDFIHRIKESQRPNLAIEALRQAIEREVRAVHPNNIVKQENFSEKLRQTINKYINGSLDTATVIAELVAFAKEVSADRNRATKLGLSEDELAFYDAVTQNASALALGKDKLSAIVRDLVAQVRADATVDWQYSEQVRARMRSKVKRLLRRYGYPPDQAADAVDRVLRQAEASAETWTR